MGPTDRGDAISGIIEDLKCLGVVPLSVVGKPVSKCPVQICKLNDPTHPLTAFSLGNILLRRARLLSLGAGDCHAG